MRAVLPMQACRREYDPAGRRRQSPCLCPERLLKITAGRLVARDHRGVKIATTAALHDQSDSESVTVPGARDSDPVLSSDPAD